MEVQLFEDSEQNGIALYDETNHLHASQIDEIQWVHDITIFSVTLKYIVITKLSL